MSGEATGGPAGVAGSAGSAGGSPPATAGGGGNGSQTPSGANGVDDGLDRIWTIPNLITLVRLAGIGVFGWVLLGAGLHTGAAWLLGGLGATDWVDGYIARRFRQVSTLGKVIDPVADRVLFLVGVSCILADGSAPLWLGLVVLAREALVSVATVWVAALGGRRMDVIWAGKAGTFALMWAFPAFLLGHGGSSWATGWEDFGWVAAVAGLGLGWFAAGAYVPRAVTAVREGRRARAVGGSGE